MKKRQGFVSNSSSSSFIVFLSKESIGFDELSDEIFGTEFNGDDVVDSSEYYSGGKRELTQQMVVDFVLEELGSPATVDDISTELYADVSWEMYNCQSKFENSRNQIYCDINLPEHLVEACKKMAELEAQEVAELEANGLRRYRMSQTTIEQVELRKTIIDKYKLMSKNLGLDYKGTVELGEAEAKVRAEKMIEDNKDKVIYIIEYADDTAYSSLMEHCGILEERLNAHRISHH